MKLKLSSFVLCTLLCLLSACSIYSFTGASIPVGTKTMSISYFQNKASDPEASISSIFTEQLKSYFISQSDLNLVEGYADVELSGDISGYNISPTAIQGDDKAALNRMTITISVRFINNIDEKFSFNQSFTRFRDFDSRLNIMSVKNDLIDEISKELVEDIYQKAFVNW